MQRIAVVVDRDQRLQRGADVVELDFLRVQAAARLDVVLELLTALVDALFIIHRQRKYVVNDIICHELASCISRSVCA